MTCLYIDVYMDHDMYSSSQDKVNILFLLHGIEGALELKSNGNQVIKWKHKTKMVDGKRNAVYVCIATPFVIVEGLFMHLVKLQVKLSTTLW